MISLRDYLYLGAIAIIVGGLLWWHHSGVLAGEARSRASEQKAVVAQQVKDQANAKQTTDSLNAELASLRNTPAPVGVRCIASRVQAPKPASGTIRPGEPATPAGSVPEVPTGTGTEPDLGPSLQRLARSADIVSARDRACLVWAKGL